MVYIHTKFHFPVSSDSLFIAAKQKYTCIFALSPCYYFKDYKNYLNGSFILFSTNC
jgi:hypothetical protein